MSRRSGGVPYRTWRGTVPIGLLAHLRFEDGPGVGARGVEYHRSPEEMGQEPQRVTKSDWTERAPNWETHPCCCRGPQVVVASTLNGLAFRAAMPDSWNLHSSPQHGAQMYELTCSLQYEICLVVFLGVVFSCLVSRILAPSPSSKPAPTGPGSARASAGAA